MICLFVSFELNSRRVSEYDFEDVKIKDCLKYLDKGKILHKFEDFFKSSDSPGYKDIVTIFSYNQRTYEHTLTFEIKGYGIKEIEGRDTQLVSASCVVIDFDKFNED